MLNTIFSEIKNFVLKIFIKKSSNQELNKIRDDIFSDTIVEELMLTRSDIDAVNANINLTEICQIFIKTEHTRIPVYQDDLDNILGFIHIKDVFKMPGKTSGSAVII